MSVLKLYGAEQYKKMNSVQVIIGGFFSQWIQERLQQNINQRVEIWIIFYIPKCMSGTLETTFDD